MEIIAEVVNGPVFGSKAAGSLEGGGCRRGPADEWPSNAASHLPSAHSPRIPASS
jgi:hypothetical protein